VRDLTPAAAGPTASPARALLAGALVPIAVVGVLATAAGLTISPAAAWGAVIGAVLAAVSFSVGPLVLTLARTWSPPAVMAVAMTAYLVLIGVLAVAYLMLLDRSWLAHGWTGWTLLGCAAASIAGMIRAAGRLRVLAFDGGGSPSPDDVTEARPAGEPDRPGYVTETAGQPGNEPTPHTGSD